jgi:hypothetical protein
MKKRYLIGIFVLIILVPNVFAYSDCNPDACPIDQIDNGVVCSGPECFRTCSIPVCAQDWSLVFSETIEFVSDDKEEEEISSSFSSSDSTKCYNFTYQGSSTNSDTKARADSPSSGDCDFEAIGGFWDQTQRNSPWFSTMGNSYIGNVGDNEFDYLLKIMRAHTEEDDNVDYREDTQVTNKIICAPNAVACSGAGGKGCNNQCYGRQTALKVHQGYYVDNGGSEDSTLYNDNECGFNDGGPQDYVDDNRVRGTRFLVYESSVVNQDNQIICDRIHEPPFASNVKVLPVNPNAGQDLTCSYTYNDPEEFTEQNSIFEWWKNGVNQNINSEILDKSNLNPGDQLYCKVTPSDGLLFGNKIQSSNVATVSDAVKNPTFSINNNQIWNQNGHFGEKIFVNGFNEQLQSALNNCIPDTEGFCDIPLTFSSDSKGAVQLSGLDIVYSNVDSSGSEGDIDNNPNVTLVNPQNNHLSDIQNVSMTCSASDDNSLSSISLYNNLSGNWELVETKLSSGIQDSKTFTLSNIPDNAYFIWNCLAKDNANQESFGVNRSINIKLPVESSAIDVKNLNVLESDFDLQTFEFTIHNSGENTINDLSWQFDTGDNLIVSSSQNIASLNPNEEIIVILQHDYSNLGSYNILASANGNSNQITDSETAAITVGDLEIINFNKLSTDGTKALFELQAKNYLSQAINGISWSLDTGNNVISSNSQFNLNPDEIAFIYVEHDYLTNGNFNAIVKINNGVYEDYKVLEVNI